jgi:hypothetical protein
LVSTEPRAIIDSILSQIGIRRVISVDDKYTLFPDVADVLGHLQALPIAELEALLGSFPGVFSRDAEIMSERVRAFWMTETEDSKQAFLAKIALSSLADGAQVAADAAAVESLPMLFQSWQFKAMGLSKWRASADTVFQESTTQKTMVLFDEDFSDQGGSQTEGLTLVKQTLAATSEEQVICCLLSHKYHVATIHDEWRRVCDQNAFPEHRVIIIPKELLIDNPADFAALIKLASVSQHYAILRDRIQEVFTASLKVATDRIRLLNLYDLDQIVFVSSNREGVWEPDTMLRLMGIFQQKETRTQAIRDATIRSASESIRRISGISTPISSPPSSALWEILHLENYEDDGLLNELHKPTDLGDIYERQGGRRYILIVPQCDLMVRTKGGFRGSDSDTVKEGVLAEVVEGEPKKSLGWKLEFYDSTRSVFVDFKRTFSAKLFCLDLCALNSDGSAKFHLDDPLPPLLTPAWAKRQKVIKKQLEQMIGTYRYINPSAKQKGEVSRHMTKASNEMTLTGVLDPDAGSIVMNFKRVGRLLPPRSTALLKAYGEFLNRDAFEHPFIQ